MTRYADPERCPDCLSPMAFGASRCPTCGLSLQGPVAAQLFASLSSADSLLERLRAQGAAPATPAHGTGGAAAEAGREPLPPPRVHRGLGGASVPRILLGLGALCLLVAALVFLAVAWSAMGVAGRTATLVGFTLVAAGLSTWAARRDLRAAAESLGVVALGLLTFDFFGARDAGWFGDIGTPGFLVVLGTTLAVVGAAASLAARRTPLPGLVGAQVYAVLGLVGAVAGTVAGDLLTRFAALSLGVLVVAAVAMFGRLTRMAVLAVGAGTLAAATWLVLVVSAADRAVEHPSLHALWVDLEVWPLLLAALMVGALGLARSLPLTVRLAAVAVGGLVLSAALLAPVADEPRTDQTAAAAALVLVASVLGWVLPRPWRRSLGAVLGLGVAWSAVTTLTLAGAAVERLVDAGGSLWSGSAGDRLGERLGGPDEVASWLLPVLVLTTGAALVAMARAFPWADRAVAPLLHPRLVEAAVAGTAILTVALYPVSVWVVLAALLVTGSSFAVFALRHQRPLPLALATVFLAAALVLGLHAEWLTLVTLAVALTLTGLLHLRWRALEVSTGAGGLLAATLAGLAWTVGALADAEPAWTAVAALLLLSGLVLAGPLVDQRVRVSGPATYARLGVEVGALVSAAVVADVAVTLAAQDSRATWAAVYLTLSGVAVSAMALLRPDRRAAGWLGGLLLAAASWVRLADLGVDAPEAYTLPSAVALLAVGVGHLRRDRSAGTMVALAPGLTLALVPSLLWVLADPIAVRSVLLGAGCLVLVLGGARLRWSAPVVLGAMVATLLVLRLATPMAQAVPRWALIGAAGAVLVALGITWERRVRDARRLAGYVHSLR